MNLTGRYIQYRANLATTESTVTPELQAVRIECADPAQTEPIVVLDPENAETCADNLVSFTSEATGFPLPTVQWEVSTDGGQNFSAISGETSSVLEITPTAGEDGNQYRATWSNGVGQPVNSAVATLTILPAASGNLTALNPILCPGETSDLQFDAEFRYNRSLYIGNKWRDL